MPAVRESGRLIFPGGRVWLERWSNVEGKLRLWRRTGRVEGWRLVGQTQVFQDPGEVFCGRHGGHDGHAPAAASADQGVLEEDTPDEGSPRPSTRPFGRLGASGGGRAVRWRAQAARRPDDFDLPAKAGARTPMVPRQVPPWPRHQGDQALEQFVRRVAERDGSVAPGPLEPQLQTTVLQPGQAIGRDGHPARR
jgi:hypothetical protein